MWRVELIEELEMCYKKVRIWLLIFGVRSKILGCLYSKYVNVRLGKVYYLYDIVLF